MSKVLKIKPREEAFVPTLSKAIFAELTLKIVGTANMLMAHPLQWDVGPAYWEKQPPEIAKKKIKRPTASQLELLNKFLKQPWATRLGLMPYDPIPGLDEIQEAFLRGHWLPDLTPGFPVSGFQAALAAGAVAYGGKNQGMSAKKLRAIHTRGDEQNPALARITTATIELQTDMGMNSGITKSPRNIVRLMFPIGWKTTLTIRYNAALLERDKLAQAWVWGGDFGIGQWRPSSPHGGTNGTFRLGKSGE